MVAGVLLTVVPIDSVLAALKRISLRTWTASLAIFFVGHYLNAIKLRLLVGRAFVPLGSCVRAQYAGLVANLSLPGLAGGDLVRAAYLVPVAGVNRVAIGSVADRILDTVTLLALAVIALPVAGVPAGIAHQSPGLRASLVVLVGAALLAAAVWVLRRRPVFAEELVSIAAELGARRVDLTSAVVISLVVQSAFVLTNAWLAREVGVTTTLAAWFVAWPLSKLIAVLPISLGGIGVREAALVSLMAPYGAPKDAVLASGFLWQTVLVVSGLIGLAASHWVLRPATIPSSSKASD